MDSDKTFRNRMSKTQKSVDSQKNDPKPSIETPKDEPKVSITSKREATRALTGLALKSAQDEAVKQTGESEAVTDVHQDSNLAKAEDLQRALDEARAQTQEAWKERDELQKQLKEALDGRNEGQKVWMEACQDRDAAQEQLNAAQADRNEVQKQLEEALEERDRLKREWREAVHALNKAREDRRYVTDDDTLLDMWRKLRYDIKNLAVSYFDGKSRGINWFGAEPPQPELLEIVSDYKPYMDSPRQRQLLIQGFVWSILDKAVFNFDSEHGLLWAGHSSSRFQELSQVLKPDVRSSKTDLKEYHRWRSLTSLLLQPKISPQAIDNRMQPLCKFLKTRLLPFATSFGDKPYQASFVQALSDVVRRAILLDAEFQKQRALFKVWRPTHVDTKRPCGFFIDYGIEVAMEFIERADNELLDASSRVELVVVPGLKKYGNDNGDNYDKELMLVKACVAQGLPERSVPARQPSPLRRSSAEMFQPPNAPAPPLHGLQTQHLQPGRIQPPQAPASPSTGRFGAFGKAVAGAFDPSKRS